ncbi:MAG TPA: zinc ribbon domain-containing protein [Patescibacteria group bacterium]
MPTSTTVCPKCGNTIFPTDEFCAHCGFRLSFQKDSFSIGKIIWIIFVSVVLPPFGLVWTFKYFKSKNPSQKKIAIMSLVLTIVSVILNIWLGIGIFSAVNQQINQVNSQLKGLGY